MQRWTNCLTLAGTLLGALVVVVGLGGFAAGGSLAGLFIALAVIIVGPVEDLLRSWARRQFPDERRAEAWARFIDSLTSFLFLLLLLLVLLLA